MAEYDLTPVAVPAVQTRYRTIQTKLPVPESLPVFEALRQSEPRSMMGMPPVVWDHADDFTFDPSGHQMKATVTVCSNNDLSSKCWTQVVSFKP